MKNIRLFVRYHAPLICTGWKEDKSAHAVQVFQEKLIGKTALLRFKAQRRFLDILTT